MRTVFMVMGEIVVKRGGLTRVMLDRASLFVKNGYRVKILLLNWSSTLAEAVQELQKLSRVDDRVEFIDAHDFFVMNESDLSENIVKEIYDREARLFEPEYTIDLDSYEQDLKASYFNNTSLVKIKKWRKSFDGSLVLDWVLTPSSQKMYSVNYPYASGLLCSFTFDQQANALVQQAFIGPDKKVKIQKLFNAKERVVTTDRQNNNLVFNTDFEFAAFLLGYVCEKESVKPIVIIDGANWAEVAALVPKHLADMMIMCHTSHLLPPYQSNSDVIPFYNYTFNNWEHFAAIVVLTEEQKRDILLKYPEIENIFVISNCMPLARVGLFSKDSETFLKAVCITRLDEEKNLKPMLYAFAKVIEKYKNAKLEIYGLGDAKDELVQLSKKLNLSKNVIFKGYVADVNAAYKTGLISILPGKSEGLPLALLESMANSTPVISYACKYGPRELITNGVDGFLVEPGDIDELAEKIIHAFSHPKEMLNLGQRAKNKILNSFGEDVYMQKWEELFVFVNEGNAPALMEKAQEYQALKAV